MWYDVASFTVSLVILSNWIYQTLFTRNISNRFHANQTSWTMATKRADVEALIFAFVLPFSSSHVFFSSYCFWWPTLHPQSLRVQGRHFLPYIFSSSFICFFGCSRPCVSFSVTSVRFLSEKNVHKKSQEPDCYHWNCKSELANQKHTFWSFGFADLFLEHSGVLGKCVWLKFSKRLE